MKLYKDKDGQTLLFLRHIGSSLECVNRETYETLLLLSTEGLCELPMEHIPLVPSSIPFQKRPPSFVAELQKKRLDWLVSRPKRIRELNKASKAPKVPKDPSAQKSTRKKKSSADLAKEMIALALKGQG